MIKVKLKDILERNKEIIEIDKNKHYEQVTIRMWNKGVIKRGSISGSNILGKRYVVKSGQFIISKIDARHAAFGIIPKDLDKAVITADFLAYSLDHDKINPLYFDIFTKTAHFFEECKRASSGTTNRIRLNEEKFLDIEMPLPSLKEQERIIANVKIFYNRENEIKDINNSNESYISKLRQAILQEAVQGKLVPQNPTDEPASELIKKIQKEKENLIKEGKIKKQKTLPSISEDEIPYEVPNGWEWVRFSNLLDFRKKYPMKRGPFGSAITKNIFVPKGTKTFKVYEQKNAIYNNSKLGHYYINESDFERLKGFEVEGGDIIISCSGTIGKIGFLPENAERGIINQALLKLCIDEGVILNKYFGFLFEEYIMKSEKLTDLKGTAMKNIPPIKTLQIMPIPLPPLSEQKRIVEKVDKLMFYCGELERQVKENQANSKQLMEAVLSESFF